MTATASVPASVSAEPIALDAKDLATVCVLCSHNCGLRVDVEAGKISAVRPDKGNPITHGYSCNKGFQIKHYVDHDERVETPLRRRSDGSFERVSWDEAVADISKKLVSLREQHGPRSIGLVGVGGQANHNDAAYALSWLSAVGSKRWFNAFAQEKHQHFLVDHWMFDSTPTVFFHPDQARATYMMVMGTNPRVSNRGHNANEYFKAYAADPGRRLVVIDPRETETSRQADRHVRVRPGTDAWLLLALAATIATDEDLVDSEFLSQRTLDFEALRGALAEVDVAIMSQRCGVPVETIEAIASEYASAASAAIMWDLAVEQTLFSTLISYLIRVLALLTGNVGCDGGNIFVETTTPPHLSPKRFEEPERALASGIQAISALGGFGMFSPTLVPEEVLCEHPERLRALVVEGSNPLLSFSDTARWREACEELELLVVVEPAMTETARLADYVLPTPCGYEKWEQSGFPKGYPEIYAQLRPPVVPGPAEALPEAEIYARLAEGMELFGEAPAELHELAQNALEPAGAMAYLGALQSAAKGDESTVLFWAYRTLGPRLPSPGLVSVWAMCHQNALMRRESVLRTLGDDWKEADGFAIAAELFRRMLDHPEGVEIAKADAANAFAANVGFPDGKARLAPEPMLEEIARAIATDLPTDADYPLVLGAGLRTRWTANTIQRDPGWRKGKTGGCSLHIGPADAEALAIADGAAVRVSTARGSVELPAEIDTHCLGGHVWIPNGFGMIHRGSNGEVEVDGVNTNELTDIADRDPISGCPHTKYTLCRVEPAI
jgi:anaerobic selenocysteine-containing dehydrogenase